ncbi:double-strand break repair helicase AddA [Oceanibium sediminis]|uniref:double-strand break repair helicase AddA n=1 Tax=Oceanibium sediminis TaxID=2026339 RepID=UPI000DD46E99|nr:double-strand break repair helicase AddA [Oceanibium sediminis]
MRQMDDATRAQVSAARPDASTWVSANAGSGKTRVLTDRVARLLLRGNDPQRILCLTYTKAAAGEMQNRLFARLGAWAMLEDDALRAQLAELGEAAQAITDDQLAKARTLFARALEVPGGLKIQTIHSFCEALLRRFPLEAGVSPQFEVMEDRQAAQLRGQLAEQLADDPASGFPELAPHIHGASLGIDDLLREILQHRDRYRADPDGPALARALGLDGPAPDPMAVLTLPQFDALIGALGMATGAGAKAMKAALVALRSGAPGALDDARTVYLKKDGTPVADRTLAPKAAATAEPDTLEWNTRIARALEQGVDRERAEAALAATRPLLRFGKAFVAAWDKAKAARGLLDYDDQIRLAAALLNDGEARDWVRYRLDGGIDHVLVDEAQDTSPAQWAVIDALTAEFFAGQGARDLLRTVFVVGDEKQSIYSFQGADPAAFGDQRQAYADQLGQVEDRLEAVELLHSFRSARPILDLVDEVMAERAEAIGSTGAPPEHKAFHANRPGRVEVWPFVLPDDKPERGPWSDPVDSPLPSAAPQKLAQLLADRVAGMLAAGTPLPGTGRAVRADDILILVRSRGRLFRAILKALKSNGVPVAGADRLRIMQNLAVRDLRSLLRAVATPWDDLSLAEAMRSPFLGLSEQDLFTLAHRRPGTLEARFHAHAAAHPRAYAIYDDLRRQADFLRAYEMLDRVLVRHGGWAALRTRMGVEAEEAVAALLQLALSYERVEPPTLTGFLDWLDSDDPEIKRQLDPAGGEVRVMTIHGAKGLEAPVVILPDTAPQQGRDSARLQPLGADAVALRGDATARPGAIRAAIDDKKDRAERENWRLLYVAMTRAERWLIVAGAGEESGAEKGWYGPIREAMAAMPGVVDDDGTLLLQEGWEDHAAPAQTPPESADAPPPPPEWLQRRAPAPARAPDAIAPSRLHGPENGTEAGTGHAGLDRAEAMDRGTRLHLLMEHLVSVPEAERMATGLRLLSPEPDQTLVAEACAVFANPALAWIFAPHGLSEVPVRGLVNGLGAAPLNGVIDRLIPGPETVWVIDYKSDAGPPGPVDLIPDAYAAQLALYVSALAQIYPGRQVRGAILWTRDGGHLTPLSHEAVSAALQRPTGH